MGRMVDCRLSGVVAEPTRQILAIWKGRGGWLEGDAWLATIEVGLLYCSRTLHKQSEAREGARASLLYGRTDAYGSSRWKGPDMYTREGGRWAVRTGQMASKCASYCNYRSSKYVVLAYHGVSSCRVTTRRIQREAHIFMSTVAASSLKLRNDSALANHFSFLTRCDMDQCGGEQSSVI